VPCALLQVGAARATKEPLGEASQAALFVWRPMSDWDDFLSGQREYALLAELLAFVADRIGDEDAAKKFILDWYWWEDPFPWVFDSLEVDAIIQDLHAADRYFWRKLECVTIDWKRSSAVYTGPRIVTRRDGGKEWPLFADGRPVTMRANLVQFRVDVALKRLRLLKLVPPAAPEPMSAPTPGPPPRRPPDRVPLPPSDPARGSRSIRWRWSSILRGRRRASILRGRASLSGPRRWKNSMGGTLAPSRPGWRSPRLMSCGAVSAASRPRQRCAEPIAEILTKFSQVVVRIVVRIQFATDSRGSPRTHKNEF
jgi:hypothetical protein